MSLFSLPGSRSAARSVVGTDDVDVERSMQTVRVGGAPPRALGGDLPRVVLVQHGSRDALEELLLGVANGDREALVALERCVGGLVRANIRRVLRDASRSDAVTQEFFAEVPREVTNFDPGRDNAQAWLLTLAHQRATNGLIPGHAATA